jgi:hypothetical protein
VGSIKFEECGPGWPEQNVRLYLQNNQNKKGWHMSDVLNKCEALSSNPNTAKKKKNVKPFLKNT